MKKSFLFSLLVCLAVLVGCGSLGMVSGDMTYASPVDSNRFMIVSEDVIKSEYFSDGLNNDLRIFVLVDKHTRVMYMLTAKYKRGFGMALEVMVDSAGKPLIYQGAIE